MARESLFTPEEVRRISAEAVRQCRIELLKAGRTGRRSTRANREALYQCVKNKWIEKVREKVATL